MGDKAGYRAIRKRKDESVSKHQKRISCDTAEASSLKLYERGSLLRIIFKVGVTGDKKGKHNPREIEDVS